MVKKASFYAKVVKSSFNKYETFRITIPKSVVEALSLQQGDLVEVTISKIARRGE